MPYRFFYLIFAFFISVFPLSLSAADAPLKVAFVYTGPINDTGWNAQHNFARDEVMTTFGDQIETKNVDKVADGPDSARVIRKLARDGYGLIFTTSWGFMDSTIKVAKDFPNVHFEHCSGYKRADNVGTYDARLYEARYLAGMIAGKSTQSNKIGYIAAFPIPALVRGINAFALGAQAVNPDAEVHVIFTSAWFDPSKEGDAIQALIAQGADVVTHHTASKAPAITAQEKGVKFIGHYSDYSKYAPDVQLTSVIMDWRNFYTKTIQSALDNNWASDGEFGGMKEGFARLAPLHSSVPADVTALVEETRQQIISGDKNVFSGPILDQSGQVRVAEGEALTVDEAAVMDYLVAGVLGTI